MAKKTNESGAKHLTSLDLDISGIQKSLEEAKRMIEEQSLELGKVAQQAMQKGMQEGATKNPVQQSMEQTTAAAEEAAKAVDTLFKESTQTHLVGKNAVSVIRTEVQSLGNEYETLTTKVKTYASGDTETTNTVTRNHLAKEKAAKRAAEAAEREAKKEEQARQREIDKTKKLAEQYEMLAARAERSGNQEIAKQARAIATAISQIVSQMQNQKTITDEQRKSIEQCAETLRKLNIEYLQSGAAGETFLKKIADKAAWMGAFYISQAVYRSVAQIPAVIKETEDAVVELQRVLRTDVAQNKISDELYEIGYEYGRSFQEVAEVATKFAQAGYEWNDVISLTKGTMLALNTAELDVTQSTEGLIAIIQQWNLEASDYATLIDKINITADRFPVTSEKIVAALQRVSGTANNANLSIDETIGLVTALAESTGRSGAVVGTALNSLIAFTTQSKALMTFATIPGMEDVINQYRRGTISILELWRELAKNIKDLDITDELFESNEYDEFLNSVTEGNADALEKIQSVYGAAGNYRKNYFIALLNDLAKQDSTVDSVVKNITDAFGYSEAENEKYMKTLTAEINQLVIALKETAVLIGESGLLDFAKLLINIATGIVRATNAMGGIIPPLTVIAGLLLNIQRQKIVSFLDNVIKKITSIPSKLATIKNDIASIKRNSDSASASAKELSVALSLIGDAIAAWGIVSMIASTIKSAAEEIKQVKLDQYANALNDSISAQDELKELQNRLNEAIGEQASLIDIVNGKYDDEIEKIENMSAAELKRYLQQLEYAAKLAERTLEKGTKSGNIDIGDYIKGWTGALSPEQLKVFQNLTTLAEQIQYVQGVIDATPEDLRGTEVYGKRLSLLDALVKAYDAANDAIKRYKIATGELTEETEDNTEASGKQLSALDIVNKQIEANTAELEASNKAIDKFQSGISTVYSALDEFNESGRLSIDTIQALVAAGGDFISILDFSGNSVSINKEKLDELLGAQENNIQAMLRQSYVNDLLSLSNQYLGTNYEVTGEKAVVSTNAVNAIAQAIGLSIPSFENGAQAAYDFAAGLAAISDADVSSQAYQDYIKAADDLADRYAGISKYLKGLGGDINAWSSNAAKASENAQKKSLQNQKTALEQQKKDIKEYYDAQIDGLKAVQEENKRLDKQETYLKNKREAEKNLAKAETRSGAEYREKEAEAREKLEEIEAEWEKQQRDWSLEDQVKAIEALRDAEIAVIDKQITEISNQISNLSSSATSTLYTNYKEQFVDPAEEVTVETLTDAFDEITENFESRSDVLEGIATDNAGRLYLAYKEGFFTPMETAISRLQMHMAMVGLSTPVGAVTSSTVSNNYNNSSSVVNNTDNVSNMYNQYSLSPYSRLQNFFRMP